MSVQNLLLNWYDTNARELPWRSSKLPYHTLVSEFMLQQTQVETVLPYFQHFIETWPTVQDLANAEEQAVLKAWEGLGYYRRAVNLHQSAKMIVQTFNGQVPSTTDALLKLPGVGPYTAAAIASIAFGVPVAAMDGNIRRVYARLFAITGYLAENETENQLKEIAQATLSKERPGDFNQALMDLGATICKPRNPLCYECPLKTVCLAFQKGLVSELPRRKEKPKVPHYVVTAAVISEGEKVLIAQRAKDDLLGGMWEFPGGKLEESDVSFHAGLKREILEELGVKIDVGEAVGVYKHAYTHYKITLHAFMATLQHGESLDKPHGKPECEVFEWVLPEALSKYPMGKVDRLISKQLLSKRLTD